MDDISISDDLFVGRTITFISLIICNIPSSLFLSDFLLLKFVKSVTDLVVKHEIVKKKIAASDFIL